MRSAAPALLPIFRSRLQADILAALLLDAEEEHSLTDLARRFDAPLSTVHGEVKRLTEAGLLHRRSVGRSALVRANVQNRLVEPLTELLFLSWGPMQVVADEFAALPQAERVMILVPGLPAISDGPALRRMIWTCSSSDSRPERRSTMRLTAPSSDWGCPLTR